MEMTLYTLIFTLASMMGINQDQINPDRGLEQLQHYDTYEYAYRDLSGGDEIRIVPADTWEEGTQ